MKSLNQCNFIGNLGADPETRYTPAGDACCNFSIAVSESYKNNDGDKVEKTEWVRIVAWRGLAEICQEYLAKGSKVFVSGRLKTRSWEQDGITRYASEIVIDFMQMLDTRGGSGEGSPTTNQKGTGKQTGRDAGAGRGKPAGKTSQQPNDQYDFPDDLPY